MSSVSYQKYRVIFSKIKTKSLLAVFGGNVA
jgi:hypothetical protein